jgi:hypothetical protein
MSLRSKLSPLCHQIPKARVPSFSKVEASKDILPTSVSMKPNSDNKLCYTFSKVEGSRSNIVTPSNDSTVAEKNERSFSARVEVTRNVRREEGKKVRKIANARTMAEHKLGRRQLK